MSAVELTADEARRIALTAQGFADPRPAKPGVAALRKLIKRLHSFQLDPINVVARAQYMPAFSRLGPYDTAHLDKLAYKNVELFEYIGHAAALVDTDLHPVLRWRMDENTRSEKWVPAYLDEALAEVRERGPLTPGELSFQRVYERVPGRWGGSYGKSALRRLAYNGAVTVVGRRGMEQVYDLTDRVIPAAILEQPTPDPASARADLLVLAARALGVATAKDLGEYFLMRHIGPDLKRLVSEGRLVPAHVKGWNKPAFMHPDAKAKAVDARAIVSPFDSLLWTRERVKRLFGFDYLIEIYVPEAKRRYGYYVYPFLMGEDLVARVDLKVDRGGSVLRVIGAWAEPTSSSIHLAPALAGELGEVARWVGAGAIEVERKGDLATALRRAL